MPIKIKQITASQEDVNKFFEEKQGSVILRTAEMLITKISSKICVVYEDLGEQGECPLKFKIGIRTVETVDKPAPKGYHVVTFKPYIYRTQLQYLIVFCKDVTEDSQASVEEGPAEEDHGPFDEEPLSVEDQVNVEVSAEQIYPKLDEVPQAYATPNPLKEDQETAEGDKEEKATEAKEEDPEDESGEGKGKKRKKRKNK